MNYQAFYNFTVSPGNTYDYRPFNGSVEALLFNNLYGAGNCLDRLKDCKAGGVDAVCQEADAFCADQVEDIYDSYLGRDEYDIRELTPDPFPYMFFSQYLQTPAVQQAIGAFTNHSDNGVVWKAFRNTGDDAREVSTIEDMRYLLERNVTVAIYAGDADFNCNWLGNEAVATEVDAPGFGSAGYTDLQTTSDDDAGDVEVHGQVKQAGRFSFTRVFESGHMVPFYQPAAALALFRRAIGGRDVATGRETAEPGYRTKGPARSTYRNGQATMQWEVVPANATYNVTTHRPGAPWQDVTARRNGPDTQRGLDADLGTHEL